MTSPADNFGKVRTFGLAHSLAKGRKLVMCIVTILTTGFVVLFSHQKTIWSSWATAFCVCALTSANLVAQSVPSQTRMHEIYPLQETSNDIHSMNRPAAESIPIEPLPKFRPATGNALANAELDRRSKDNRTAADVQSVPDLKNNDFSKEFGNAYEHLKVAQLPAQEDKFDPNLFLELEPTLAVPTNAETLPLELTPIPPREFDAIPSDDHALGKTEAASGTINGFSSPEIPYQSLQSQIAPQSGTNDDSPLWWKQLVTQPLHVDNQTSSVDTNSLVFEALKNSPRIQAISQNPLIREQQIIEADSDFDPVSFVRSKFEDRVDPVGNTLTTGGAAFLEDNIWSGEFGLRKKTRSGASVQISERLGFQNSNSTFFLPQDQGTATLSLNVSQPLLRGRGKYYNNSQVLIAQAAGGAAWDTFSSELQDELEQVTQAYWRLYFERSLFLQKKRNVERGEQILAMLEGRSELDSMPNQITRARSAVLTRKTDLANAFRDVRNSETEIRRRIADRNWMANQTIELLPIELAQRESWDVPMQSVVLTAIENRREIKEVIQRARIAGIQKDVGVNELLPELTLLMGTYVSALKGESQLGQAIQDQFGEVTPGYSFGIEYELPYKNRAAESRLAQRKFQLAKIKAEVDETMQRVIAESQIAHRRVTSALQTLDAAEEAILAARADMIQNLRRWEAFGLVEGDLADGQSPVTILDQVLDSQERLTAAELIYAQAELELKIAEIGLQRTMGTLLVEQDIHLNPNQPVAHRSNAVSRRNQYSNVNESEIND